MRISKEHFEYVCNLARDNAAIVLESGKEYLVESRLGPLARREGFDSLASLIDHMQSSRLKGEIHTKAVEALTTNETLFFRDFHPFEALESKIVPEILIRRASERKITIWSGACSTGQEPYSLAMLLRSKFPNLSNWKIEIIATDLSTQVLEKANAGVYSQFEVNRGLPLPMLAKYFTKNGNDWQLKPEIREMIDFRPLNLIQNWPALPKFDIVLMRNVMIYFDVPTKKRILDKIKTTLHPGGALFLGASETTINIDTSWEIVSSGKTVYYRQPDSSKAVASGSYQTRETIRPIHGSEREKNSQYPSFNYAKTLTSTTPPSN